MTNPETRGQEQNENLTNEQVEALKTIGIELVDEHPSLVFCRCDDVSSLIVDKETIIDSGIKKPIIFSEEKAEPHSLNEVIDILANENQFRDFIALENFYALLIDAPEKKEKGSSKKYLDNVDELQKACEKSHLLSSRVAKHLEKWGGYDGLLKKLQDYENNFFPGKFSEMADLRDQVNTWLKSLKVPE